MSGLLCATGCLALAVSVCSTQERRGARRELKNLAKKEAVSEEEQAKKLADLELREQEELLHSQLCDTSQVGLLCIAIKCKILLLHGYRFVHVPEYAHPVFLCVQWRDVLLRYIRQWSVFLDDSAVVVWQVPARGFGQLAPVDVGMAPLLLLLSLKREARSTKQ